MTDRTFNAFDVLAIGQAEFRDRLARENDAVARRLMQAYQQTLVGLDQSLAAFDSVADRVSATAQLLETAEFRNLQRELEISLGDLRDLIEANARQMELDGFAAAGDYVANIFQTLGITSAFNQPAVETMVALVGYVDGGAFQQSLNEFAGKHSEHIADIILSDASQGRNPRATANHVLAYLTDMQRGVAAPLADILRTTRTVQVWSARRGTQQIYQQNTDIVEGWWWGSALDRRVCPSCLAMHGQEFSVREVLNDHYNGRCAMIPITRRNRDQRVERGEDWFRRQDRGEQRFILGGAKLRAWEDGAVRFEQFTTTYQDPIYGEMRQEASLLQILGAGARAYYR